MYKVVMVTVVAAGFFLVGSASYSREQASEALTIAQASGLKKLRDLTHKDLERAQGTRKASSGKTMAVHSVSTATGASNAPSGVSTGTAAGVAGALAILGSLPVSQPERQPRFLVWLPQAEATDSNVAREKATAAILDAVAKAVPNHVVELAQRSENPRVVIRIVGDGCVDCSLASWVFDNIPRELVAPQELGAYSAYVWGGFNGRGVGTIEGYPLSSQHLTSAERLSFYRNVSANLPKWIYIYLPADERIAPYPQILQQGRSLLFVEPGLSAQVSTEEEQASAPDED